MLPAGSEARVEAGTKHRRTPMVSETWPVEPARFLPGSSRSVQLDVAPVENRLPAETPGSCRLLLKAFLDGKGVLASLLLRATVHSSNWLKVSARHILPITREVFFFYRSPCLF